MAGDPFYCPCPTRFINTGMEIYTCKKCGILKDADKFGKSTNPRGRTYWCKVCLAAKARRAKGAKRLLKRMTRVLGAEPAEWRVIPKFPYYEISNLGGIRKVSTGRPLKPVLNPYGRHVICLRRDNQNHIVQLSRCLCEVFHGPPPSDEHQCCHNNGNRLDNRSDNLRWDTPTGNMADMVQHGTRLYGEKVPTSKLRDSQVIEIRDRHAAGEKQCDLASDYGVVHQLISQIVLRQVWRHLSA